MILSFFIFHSLLPTDDRIHPHPHVHHNHNILHQHLHHHCRSRRARSPAPAMTGPTPGTQCNIPGVANAVSFRSFGGVLSTAQCASVCRAFTGCLSFKYNDVNSVIEPDYCTLFVTSVAQDQVDNSPSQVALGYQIFDLGCYYCPEPAVTATSSAAP
jgi:hypothetical protein